MDFSDNQRCSMNTLLSKLEDPATAAPRTHILVMGTAWTLGHPGLAAVEFKTWTSLHCCVLSFTILSPLPHENLNQLCLLI